MRTVVVSFYEAYPPDSGAASVTYNCARYSPGERALVQVGGRVRREERFEGLRVVTLPGTRGRLEKLLRIGNTIDRIVEVCIQLAPEIVFLEGASWSVYHLALLRRLRRAVGDAFLVYHAHNVEYHLRREKQGPVIAAVTRWAEQRLFREADLAFAVSGVDRQQIETLYGVRTSLLPNGVDDERFGKTTEDEIAAVRRKYGLADRTVLFMGFYAYKPNREAVDELVDVIFPRVVEFEPRAKLFVIGSHVPHRRPWLVCPGTIPYEELPAFVAACRVGVAPIRSGSGTRLKIVEYLAAGLPVVSTAKGAEGLAVRDGEDILVAETSEGVADAIVRLFAEPAFARSLADRGRTLVRDKYAWPQIMANCWTVIEAELRNRKETQSAGGRQ